MTNSNESLFTERNQEMAKLYHDGQTLQQVGDCYGLSRERVRQILERNYPQVIRRQPNWRPIRNVSSMAKLYRDGYNLAEIGEHFGLSYQTVSDALHREHPDLIHMGRPPGKRTTSI